MKKKIIIGVLSVMLLMLTLVTIYYLKVRLAVPISENQQNETMSVRQIDQNHWSTNNGSWLQKNRLGVWEIYLQGDPLECGMAFGALGKKLLAEKESAFISEIENRVPSDNYLLFLKYLVGWMNRDLDDYTPKEYLQEIYGSSLYMADSFDNIAPKYNRGLSYHAAHDIGHALQNMNLVGCTSFAINRDKSANGKLLIGRNFDFYFGEEFAKDRIIAFYNPAHGYQFMSVTWACFSGVVSGMNEKGLTITLNSDKSAIPTKGKTPVSLIARQILQYASTIDEAYMIAQEYPSFVSESFLIGSKEDHRAALIEKTPEKTALIDNDTDKLIVTNHYQSPELVNSELNKEYIKEGVSQYRYDRVSELIDSLAPIDPASAVAILRDKKGLHNTDIGLANEKSINQLLAHHGIVFSPEDMMVWVAAPPYQLGEFMAYDLQKIFHSNRNKPFTYTDSLDITADPFLKTPEYDEFRSWVKIRDKIQHHLFKLHETRLTNEEVRKFIHANPRGFLTYYYLGDYFKSVKSWAAAKKYYSQGLECVIAKKSERQHILDGIDDCNKHL